MSYWINYHSYIHTPSYISLKIFMCMMWGFETWCAVEFILVLLCSEMTVMSVEGMHSLDAEVADAYTCEREMK